jgi:hypothetical protein
MPLQVIGAGWGRTGTLTLKTALEELGFAPCHHMHEVLAHPEQAFFWQRAATGEAVEWEEIFAAYQACVDWPSCHFYRQLAARYPDAKVILTERDERQWYESISNTILKSIAAVAASNDPARQAWFSFVTTIISDQSFANDFSEANMRAAYRRHNAAVRETIPADRLLVFNVAEGWPPLCRFLGVNQPVTSFPRTNSREEFWQKAAQR